MRNLLVIFFISMFFTCFCSTTFAEEIDSVSETGKQSEQAINNSVTDSEAENIINDVNNPIEYDASSENIKDKNFTPKARPQESKEKVKKEKTKKDKKSKNSKSQKDVTTDNQNNNSENLATQEEENRTEYQEPVEKKVYTQDDYEQMYRDMPVPTHSYMHGMDPEQYYDIKDTAWSPYPLLRLNAPIYFKSITILPGYYLLTPREYNGNWYVLFKESGKVKYIIPTFSKDYVDAFYYRDHLKELDMTKSQRWQIKFLNAWGKYIRSSKRRPAIKTNLELTDLDNNFLLVELYYGFYKYSMVFRSEQY